MLWKTSEERRIGKHRKSDGFENVGRVIVVWKRQKKCLFSDTLLKCQNCDVMANHVLSGLKLSLLRRLCVEIAMKWPSEIGPNILVLVEEK